MIKIQVNPTMTLHIPEEQDDILEQLSHHENTDIRNQALKERFNYTDNEPYIPEEEKDYEYGEIDSVVDYINDDYYGYDNPLLDEEYPGEFEETYGVSKKEYYDYIDYE